MALVIKDRVKVTSTSVSSGTFTLGAAVTGFQSFSAIGNGNTTYYTIAAQSGSEWEAGLGTVTLITGTYYLSRDTVFDGSSGPGTPVNFSAGTKDVFCTYPAERAVYLDSAGSYPVQNTFNALTANTAALNAGTILAVPSDGTDIANKSYVDTIASSGITYHQAVNYESPNTVGNLNATYTNGGTTPTWTSITGTNTVNTGSAHSLSENDVIVFGSTTNGITAGTAYFVKSTPSPTSITLTLTYDGAEITTLTAGAVSITSLANAGVGATLVNAGAKAALVIDGVTVSATQRVLVYSQTNAYENGVYVVSVVGTPDPGGTNWVLTRASDADKYGPLSTTRLGQNDAFFVTGGNTGAGETYLLSNSGTIVFGTTGLSFNQIATAQIYSAGTGLTLNSTTFSITPVGVAGTYGSASQVPVIVTNASGQVTSVTNTSITIASSSVTGLASSATVDTTSASNITSGTLPTGRITGSYTGLTGTGTLTAGTWNATTVAANYGGTGISAYVIGDILYASSTTALSTLAGVATGNALISGGVGASPSWGKIGLATHVSGTLAVSSGGTGNTSYTDGQLLIGNSTGNTLTKATLTAGSGVTITNAPGSITIAASGGTTTNALTFSNAGTGAASGTTFNGSVARTISYNSVGAPSTGGSGATGTWNINVSGSSGSTLYANESGAWRNIINQAQYLYEQFGSAVTGVTYIGKDAAPNYWRPYTLVAGSGITLTVGASPYTTTIAASGGGGGGATFVANTSSGGSITLTTPAGATTSGQTVWVFVWVDNGSMGAFDFALSSGGVFLNNVTGSGSANLFAFAANTSPSFGGTISITLYQPAYAFATCYITTSNIGNSTSGSWNTSSTNSVTVFGSLPYPYGPVRTAFASQYSFLNMTTAISSPPAGWTADGTYTHPLNNSLTGALFQGPTPFNSSAMFNVTNPSFYTFGYVTAYNS